MILTATLRLINLTGSPARLDDEGTYMAQAYAVAEWGELAHYTYWYDHPPAGWLQLALWTVISGPDFGGNAVAAGRYLMVIVAVITAALLWVLARRIEMSRWASAAAVAVFALSPLAISLSRTVYLDNLATAWVLGALVLLCSPRYRLSAMFGAATCFGIAVLTKETMLLLPMFAWLVWARTAPVTRRYALAVFVAVFGVVVSTYVLMAVLRGELVPGPGHVSLWDGIRFQLWERTAGGALDDPVRSNAIPLTNGSSLIRPAVSGRPDRPGRTVRQAAEAVRGRVGDTHRHDSPSRISAGAVHPVRAAVDSTSGRGHRRGGAALSVPPR